MTVYTSICDVRGNKCATESSPHKKHNKKCIFSQKGKVDFFISAQADCINLLCFALAAAVCIFFSDRDLLHHTAVL